MLMSPSLVRVGCCAQISIVADFAALVAGRFARSARSLARLRRGREMTEAVRGYQKAEKQARIVADVQQVAGDDGVRPGASVGENDSDQDQQRDLRPASP